ncbi:hypothetical protein VTK56DRAFT_1009 [Thermocarpiscus australiensis]
MTVLSGEDESDEDSYQSSWSASPKAFSDDCSLLFICQHSYPYHSQEGHSYVRVEHIPCNNFTRPAVISRRVQSVWFWNRSAGDRGARPRRRLCNLSRKANMCGFCGVLWRSKVINS